MKELDTIFNKKILKYYEKREKKNYFIQELQRLLFQRSHLLIQ